MTRHLFQSLSLAALLAAAIQPALAAPVLKSQVSVTGGIVTVGDMFDDVGALADKPLFRAPAPGTAGTVSIEDINAAAARIGLTDYLATGITGVLVARAGTIIDQSMLIGLIEQDLHARGVLAAGMTADTRIAGTFEPINAEAAAEPVKLLGVNYLPGNGAFTARFAIAGRPDPLEIGGTVELQTQAPYLKANLASGTILTEDDIEMKPVPVQFAETNGVVEIKDLVGKQLVRQIRQGTMLRGADVAAPQLIARNQQVTVYYRAGTMTLTVKGVALNAAARGEPVSVLNQSSKKVLQAVATAEGAVEVTNSTLNVAGL